jgi:hypothetical protein
MAHESNPAGQIGARNPNLNHSDFVQRGLSHDQANEAAAAAKRAREAQGRTG